MKKLVFLYLLFFSSNAFALYNNTIPNKCGTIVKIPAIFQPISYTCAQGQYLPANTLGCQNCTHGHTCDGGTYKFNETTDQGIIASVYTCNSGYFLPANSETCRTCPTGYTCNGGTFTYNPAQSQGIKSNSLIIQSSIANLCSSNYGRNMNAVYVPHTINLNWYDRDNIVAQTTCTYGEKITLPNITPTRPGYIFSGWRLRTTPVE